MHPVNLKNHQEKTAMLTEQALAMKDNSESHTDDDATSSNATEDSGLDLEISSHSLCTVDKLENILDTLKYNAMAFEFICYTPDNQFAGTIERFIILRLLENELFGKNAPLLYYESIDSAWPNLRDINEDNETSMRLQLRKRSDLKDLVVDLRPYIDREPALVMGNASLRHVHAHLRKGEYSVLVAEPSSIKITGMISRFDLMPNVLRATLDAKNIHTIKEYEKKKREFEYADTSEIDGTTKENIVAEIAREKEKIETELENSRPIAEMDDFDTIHPFEPRFYDLMYEYFEHRHRMHEESKKQGPVPVKIESDVENGKTQTKQGTSGKEYTVIAKPRRFSMMKDFSQKGPDGLAEANLAGNVDMAQFKEAENTA
jgi:hypothetical protein